MDKKTRGRKPFALWSKDNEWFFILEDGTKYRTDKNGSKLLINSKKSHKYVNVDFDIGTLSGTRVVAVNQIIRNLGELAHVDGLPTGTLKHRIKPVRGKVGRRHKD